ncbi:hypothetical protein FIV42_12410 [Persicimonas caeni]|uniref:Uncharacterized protein n=1 Tax=Persicimonas caeni TaxID=2292766 RepID=A0A4Y6PT89_PERCE|nr:hypothetical protein [Persicimonas caeni]QDG51518.1 hypothetical protein FIV42_12410 [Persicimonas caeni]QED32739.1 hypothetical protein FRD00_12405 [Persicimonas caeni]
MDTANFSQQLRVLPTLVKMLAEDSTHKFKVSAAGHLSVLRGARWTASKTPLDVDAVQSLAREIAAKREQAVLGPWYLRVLRGADGLTIFGERRLDVPAEPLEDTVEDQLLQLARAGSTGSIAGTIGSKKGAVLLWLASQLGRRELVFVSDVPPRDLLEPTATHVFPPANDRERRDLERLLRAHDCIFWDGLNRGDDLVSFAGTPGAHNRWFTIDADSPDALARQLRSVVTPAGQIRLDSCLFIDVDAEGHSAITSLVRRDPSGWAEILSGGPSVLEVLEGLDDLFVAPAIERTPEPKPASEPKPLSEPKPHSEPLSEPESQPEVSSSPSNSPERRRRPSPMAGIVSPKRAGGQGRGSKSIFPNADKPPEEPTVNSDIRPLDGDSLDGDSLGGDSLGGDSLGGKEQSEPTVNSGEHPVPDGMSLDELLKSDEIDEEELLRQSGEIDLQAFVKARNARMLQQHAKADENNTAERTRVGTVDPSLAADPSDLFEPSSSDAPPPGLGLEYSSEHAETNVADGAAVDAMLEKMGIEGNGDGPPQFPDVDHSKLTPPVRDETTALTPVDMERIRESAHDDVSWLLQDDFMGGEPADDETLSDHKLPQEVAEEGTSPSKPIWEADPASTDELTREDLQQSRSEWSEAKGD